MKIMSTSADSAASTAPSEEVLKLCPRCPEGQQYKPMSEFANDRTRRDGKNSICKECKARKCREYYAKRKREDGEGDDDIDDEGGNDPPEPDETRDADIGDDLYMMQNSRIPGEVKIGRSIDPEIRRRSLQASQNYRMNLLAMYPEAGCIEARVHSMLAYCRVLDVPGREWFECSTQTAFGAIGTALDEQKNW